MSSGRGLSAASGSGQFTPPPPRVPASGPSYVPPPLAAGQCTHSPPTVARPSVSVPPAFLVGASTMLEVEDAVSLREGGGSFYESTLREVWINGFNDFPMEVQELLYQMFMMTEKYAGEEEQPQLDPEVWVAASGAPKKGHVYSFEHSMDTSRVLFGASSSASHATSAFTTPCAPSTSPNEMMDFIRDEIFGLESHLAHMMQMQVSDAVQAQLSQALSQVNIPPQAAPSTSALALSCE
ncbi:hypothetical protein Taro_043809 [Colocasia esculenta]|uniref:Uncharacterized protein n=1 Tax=Colocasia esculenta TaxID=4460 RepID=A0A843WZK7_COLES|nr:hypothetical protein [Colocasia esculenta]